MYIQTSIERGSKNEKRLGTLAGGFLYRILIPESIIIKY